MREKRYSRRDIDSLVTSLTNQYGLSTEVIRLVEEDLCSGMSKEDVLKYCSKKIGVGRMRVISECLRNGCTDEVIEKLSKKERDEENLKIAFMLMSKGVDFAVIENAVEDRDRLMDIAASLADKMEGQTKSENASLEKDKEPEAAENTVTTQKDLEVTLKRFREELLSEIGKKVEAGFAYEERIRQECEEKLSLAEKQIKEKDQMLVEQSQALTDARREIAEMKEKAFHGGTGDGNAEMEGVKKKLARMEEKLNAGEREEPHSNEKQSEGMISPDAGKEADSLGVVERVLVIQDGSGRTLCNAPIERTEKKSSGMAGLAAAFGARKRYKRSMMQLAISGELSKEQLQNVVLAIKDGLTEAQLCSLIENKVAADRMPQIIEIAKLENQMQQANE